VERYSVGLARSVGINDDIQLRAIEAAPLLHDMGKLAIPEFMLNKPGRLTVSESDVMKQHANIGADILSSIEFPYPVAPIVRHHHESWDGSGYPAGLKGVTIPLGARVLSVVDCFDALTSDRPYRPRLSVEDAIAVLVQRRGSMYDPVVVDKFIEVEEQLSEQAEERDADKDAIDSIATRLRITPGSHVLTLSNVSERLPVKLLTLVRSIHPSPSGLSVEDLGVILSAQLLRITSARSSALHGASENGHSIRCLCANGPLAQLTGEPEISLGERLSGWAAAHRTPIWNSDATLDLPGELAKSASIGLASSVPLVDGDVLIGTVTLYSPAGAEIDIEQRLLIQSIAPLLATALSTSIAHDEVVAVDGNDRAARETVYVVLDALLSNRARVTDRTNPEAISIVLVGLPFAPGTDRHPLLNSLRAGLSSTAGATGTVIRLSPTELLITAPVRVLSAIGIDGNSAPKSGPRSRDVRVREITNSLQLREVLGLTQTGEPTHTGKPVVH